LVQQDLLRVSNDKAPTTADDVGDPGRGRLRPTIGSVGLQHDGTKRTDLSVAVHSDFWSVSTPGENEWESFPGRVVGSTRWPVFTGSLSEWG
jgi:hypothetical protein